MVAFSLSKNSAELSGSLPRSLNPETRSWRKSGNFQPTLAVGLWHLSGNFRDRQETGHGAKFGSHHHHCNSQRRFELQFLQIQGDFGRDDGESGPSSEISTVSQGLRPSYVLRRPGK
jgi:hypothetical protein